MFLYNTKNSKSPRSMVRILSILMSLLLMITNGSLISVSALNNPNSTPMGNQISSYSIEAGESVNGTVTVTDPDGDVLTYRLDPHNAQDHADIADKGQFALNQNTGAWSYTPPEGVNLAGEIVNYYIEVSDGHGSTFHQRIEIRIEAAPQNRTFHVDGDTGNNSNDGLSKNSAFKTLQYAVNKLGPGDTLLVHESANPYKEVVSVFNSGLPEAYITIKAADGENPVINSNGEWSTLKIYGSYVIVDGLTVTGIMDELIDDMEENYEYFHRRQNGDSSLNINTTRKFNTNGISFSPDDNDGDPRNDSVVKVGIDKVKVIHHVEIRNCVVDYLGGGGIGGSECDYILLENNTITNCCWGDMWACSGISVLGSIDIDDMFNEHKIVIRNNIVAGNRHFVPWVDHGFSDGNGIIIDSTDNGSKNNKIQTNGLPWGLQPYYGKILVANNLSYFNGGSGIHAYNSANVDIINNTIYSNSATPALDYSDLFSNSSDNIRMFNNIVYSRTGAREDISIVSSTGVEYDYNLFYNYKSDSILGESFAGTTAGANNIYDEDPMFKNVYEVDYDTGIPYPNNWEQYKIQYAEDGGYFIGADYNVNTLDFDFSLEEGSPAFGSGNSEWSYLLGNTENRLGIFGTIGSPMRPVTVSDNGSNSDPSNCQGTTDTEWTSNELGHWHSCTCGEVHDFAAHIPANSWEQDNDGALVLKCTECNYIIETVDEGAEEESGDDMFYYLLMMILTKKFVITSEAGEGGTISPIGETKVRFNKDITYTITPEDGYEVESVFVDDEDIGAVTSYTFDNVRKKHTIKVNFKKVS